jgi:hypothetical protein
MREKQYFQFMPWPDTAPVQRLTSRIMTTVSQKSGSGRLSLNLILNGNAIPIDPEISAACR